MATATKTAKTLQSSTSNGAGSTTTATTWDMRTCFGGVITAKVTNGGTGPTVGCTVTVNISVDGTNWKQLTAVTAGVTNNEVDPFVFAIDAAVLYSQVVFSGNTAQAVTVEAFGHELTSFA